MGHPGAAMKTVIIYGVEHKGATWNAVQLFKTALALHGDAITEFFLPAAMPHFCIGCTRCFMQGEEFCPHQNYTAPIREAMVNADLIILASPVYLFHITGQMKALLDHFGFQFMNHRPNASMFSKTALVISIAAGKGMRSAIKDMTQSLEYWGVSRIYKFGSAVFAASWNEITEKNKLKIERKIKSISKRILKAGTAKPSLKIKGLFYLFRTLHKKSYLIPNDKEYWSKKGWLNTNRPWK
jgi:multimeric flavodoxin WrbA